LTYFIPYPHGISLGGMCVLNIVFQISHLEAEDFILVAHHLAISPTDVKKLKHLEVKFSSPIISTHLKFITMP